MLKLQEKNEMKFEELKIKTEIVTALNELEIVEPTDIQSKTIPCIKSGSDIIGISKTGSGKTPGRTRNNR